MISLLDFPIVARFWLCPLPMSWAMAMGQCPCMTHQDFAPRSHGPTSWLSGKWTTWSRAKNGAYRIPIEILEKRGNPCMFHIVFAILICWFMEKICLKAPLYCSVAIWTCNLSICLYENPQAPRFYDSGTFGRAPEPQNQYYLSLETPEHSK